ncbi:MAG: lipopolysaccharide biosynthesis protein [Chloroflexi bacterium]|nr:lipopolysaccharide biosynthesis protein [Chloroflexota bacterium]
MKSRLKQLGKDSFVYGLSGVIARGLGFFLLPIYTRVFTPSDYGTIETLSLVSSLLGSLLVMGMDSAQSFYFFEQKENGASAQGRMISGVVQWRLAWGSLIVALAILVSPLLNTLLFEGRLSWEYFAISFIGTLITQIALQSAEVYRLLYRPWSYIRVTVTNTVATAALTLIFVVVLDGGILGFFIGNTTGSLVAAVIGWWSIRGYLDWSKWHRDWWPRLLRFGAPLVPAGLSMYLLNTIDRWAIVQYHGTELLGLYSVAAKFVTLFAMVVTSFRQAWWPVAMDALNSDDGPQLFRMVGRLYMGIGVTGIILITAISPWLIRLLTTLPYYSAYTVVGVLAWQPLFYGFYLISSGGLWKREKTNWAPIGMAVAITINIIFAVLLVPEYKLFGAAASTGLAYLGWNIFSLAISERLWPVHYPLGLFGLQIGVGILAETAILLLYAQNQEIWKVVLATLITCGVILGMTLERAHIKWLLKKIGERRFSIAGGN